MFQEIQTLPLAHFLMFRLLAQGQMMLAGLPATLNDPIGTPSTAPSLDVSFSTTFQMLARLELPGKKDHESLLATLDYIPMF